MLDVDAFLIQESKDWADLRRRFERLPDDVLGLPGACGDWSPREVLAHLACWHRWMSDKLDGHARGFAKLEPFTRETVDRMNAEFVERFAEWPVTALFEMSRDAHTRAVVSVRAAAFRGFDDDWEQMIRSNTTDHYEEHRPGMDDFLKAHA